MSDEQADRLATLDLAYKQLTEERDRLRDARAFFARQLGPLPGFAGISVAAVAAFSKQVDEGWCLWVSFGFFGLVVLVSLYFSGVVPYRVLRSEKERKWRCEFKREIDDSAMEKDMAGLQPEDMLPKEAWYRFQISVERDVYGSGRKRDGRDLQRALDRERRGLFLAQFLFLVAIGFLVAARF